MSELSEAEIAAIFEAAELESSQVNAYVWAQLLAMQRSGTWRRYRLLEMPCQRCGEVVAQVMQTEPNPVLLFRQTVDRPLPNGPADTPEKLKNLKGVRRDQRWRSFPIDLWLPAVRAETHIPVLTICRCRRVVLDMPQVYRDLADGRRKRVIKLANPSWDSDDAG